MRFKGNVLYLSCFVFFSVYLIFPALTIKDKRKRAREQALRFCIIMLSFTAGFLRSSLSIARTEKILGEVEDAESVTVSGVVKNAKSDGSALYIGDALVYTSNANEPASGIKPGDTVKIEGKSYLFDKATNEGEFDSREYYISQKIYYRINADKVILLRRPSLSFAGMMWDLKKRIGDVYEKNLPPVQSALVSAMALGDKTLLGEDLKELYRVNGLSHILVISGLHISLIGLLLYRLLQGRTAIVTACVMAACGLILYGTLTGFSVSTVRAVLMFVMYLAAAAVGCGYDGLCAWSIAMFSLLVYEPATLMGSGFVMSFYQTGFIMCLNELKGGNRGNKVFRDRREKDPMKVLKNRVECALDDTKDALVFTALMTISSYPVIAGLYCELPVYSCFVNFFLLPAMGFVMVSAIAGGLTGLFVPAAARIFLYPAKVILGADTIVCEMIKNLPGASKICGFPGTARFLAYYVLLFLMLAFVYRCRNAVKRVAVFLTGSLVLIAILMFPHGQRFEMDFLDVGQGDGIYICTSEGVKLFVDGGSSSEKYIGKYTILPFLKYKGAEGIDHWFLSHLDSDHYNGFVECMQAGYKIGNLVLPEGIVRDESFDELMLLAKDAGTSVTFVSCGDSLVFSDTIIKVLSPPDTPETDDKNACSMVLLYRDDTLPAGYNKAGNNGGFKAFLGGDIDREVERELLGKNLLSDITLYKASHHGSKYSNASETLNALTPEISVISCSLTNKYGHPGAEAVENMERAGSDVFYTMYSGRIRVAEERGYMTVSGFNR